MLGAGEHYGKVPSELPGTTKGILHRASVAGQALGAEAAGQIDRPAPSRGGMVTALVQAGRAERRVRRGKPRPSEGEPLCFGRGEPGGSSEGAADMGWQREQVAGGQAAVHGAEPAQLADASRGPFQSAGESEQESGQRFFRQRGQAAG